MVHINGEARVPVVRARVRPVVISGPSMTKQSFKQVSDINFIIDRFNKTGMVSNVNSRAPFYGDVSAIGSYQECLNVVIEAQRLFGDMSSKVRERFGNDPARMVAFLEDPSNLDEAIALGMVVKPPVVPVAPVVGISGTVLPNS